MKRICIYTKDVQSITGKSERLSREIIKQIRQLKNKEKHQIVTVHELCEYLGIDPDNIINLIR
jgi:hypothetical protein